MHVACTQPECDIDAPVQKLQAGAEGSGRAESRQAGVCVQQCRPHEGLHQPSLPGNLQAGAEGVVSCAGVEQLASVCSLLTTLRLMPASSSKMCRWGVS